MYRYIPTRIRNKFMLHKTRHSCVIIELHTLLNSSIRFIIIIIIFFFIKSLQNIGNVQYI